MDKIVFQELVWQKGRELHRDMPWRTTTDPYSIIVSELMLQQTQVDRVIPKYLAFIQQYPSVASLATASLADVLILWSGLGYNRRAKFLHDSARMIMAEFDGKVPADLTNLKRLPGVGVNTAAAVLAYAYNIATPFIETNIRTVYFHYYFEGERLVGDAQLLLVVAATLDREHPREWYWALMDYGSFLKRQGMGRIDKSSHYKKQSPLDGSVRQVRGQILRILANGAYTDDELRHNAGADERYDQALLGLIKDGLVQVVQGRLHLTK